MKKESKQKVKFTSQKAIDKKSMREQEGSFRQINLNKATPQQIKQYHKALQERLEETQSALLNADKMYRIENFKNQNYRAKVVQAQKHCERVRMDLAKRLIRQYEGNKESPLFHNQHGLSPFQMLLLQYNRNQQNGQTICMTCFMDLQPQAHTVQLPCSHVLHRECGMQHLLYSRLCPACNEQIKGDKLLEK